MHSVNQHMTTEHHRRHLEPSVSKPGRSASRKASPGTDELSERPVENAESDGHVIRSQLGFASTVRR